MAGVVGMDRAAIVRIELGRAPLKYKAARAIIHFLEGNPVWVATGRGKSRPSFPLPLASDLGVDDNMSFSEVFDAHFSKYFDSASKSPEAGSSEAASQLSLSASIRHDLIGVLSERLRLWFRQVPDASLVEFMQSLVKCGDLLSLGFGRDDWKEELARRGRMDALDPAATPTSAGVGVAEQAENILLTDASSHAKLHPVKSQLDNLLAGLDRIIKEPGKKTELAEFLGAPLASVSRWLSDKREPGREITLKMLRWVELQERQQNTPGSATNTAKGKTQLGKSSYEKPKPSPNRE
jgi:DNA-binding XRE family transcriptional regulator